MKYLDLTKTPNEPLRIDELVIQEKDHGFTVAVDLCEDRHRDQERVQFRTIRAYSQWDEVTRFLHDLHSFVSKSHKENTNGK